MVVNHIRLTASLSFFSERNIITIRGDCLDVITIFSSNFYFVSLLCRAESIIIDLLPDVSLAVVIILLIKIKSQTLDSVPRKKKGESLKGKERKTTHNRDKPCLLSSIVAN